MPYAAIIATRSDLSARANDPVYGRAIGPAWDCLTAAASNVGRDRFVEFRVNAFCVPMVTNALTGKADAPILLPAHLDLLSYTSPIPASDPEISLYLRGSSRQPDSITVVWRADIDPNKQESNEIRRLLVLVPPRSLEAIELPLWAVRRWLVQGDQGRTHLADIATAAPEAGRVPASGVGEPAHREARTFDQDATAGSLEF